MACEQLPGTNSSPIVTNFVSHTLGLRGRGDYIFGRLKVKVGGGGMHSTELFLFNIVFHLVFEVITAKCFQFFLDIIIIYRISAI